VTPPDLVLRDARPDDVPVLLSLIRQLAEYEKLLSAVRATEAVLRDNLFGSTPHAWAMLAEVRGEAVGFAVWFHSFSTFTGRPSLYVEDVFVKSEVRGKGIGKVMFRELARRALKAGCARVDWSVLDWNAPAIAFYRSIGAEPVRGWTVQRLEGATLAALAE
jgi:GNAT superfamily N-acetyltransferase